MEGTVREASYHPCEVCDQVFQDYNDLVQHSQIHIAQQNFTPYDAYRQQAFIQSPNYHQNHQNYPQNFSKPQDYSNQPMFSKPELFSGPNDVSSNMEDNEQFHVPNQANENFTESYNAAQQRTEGPQERIIPTETHQPNPADEQIQNQKFQDHILDDLRQSGSKFEDASFEAQNQIPTPESRMEGERSVAINDKREATQDSSSTSMNTKQDAFQKIKEEESDSDTDVDYYDKEEHHSEPQVVIERDDIDSSEIGKKLDAEMPIKSEKVRVDEEGPPEASDEGFGDSDVDSDLKIKFTDPSKSKRYQKNQKVYKCNICPKTYTLKSSVTRHMKTHEGEFICSVCGDTFDDNSSLVKHKKSHNEEFFLCRCSKKFKDKSAMIKHLSVCGAGDRNGSDDGETKKKSAKKTEKKFEERFSDDMSGPEDTPSEDMDVDDPSFEIPEIAGLKKKKATPKPKPVDETKTAEGETTPSKKESSDKSFICEECGKLFTLKSSLKRHMNKHSLVGKCYQCSECGKTFSIKCSLRRHYQNKHAPKPPKEDKEEDTVDLEGGEPFYDKTQNNPKLDFCLIPTTPKKEKPFKCFICGNTFGHSSSLQRHLKTHAELGEGSEEKVIQCEICSETFNQFFNLQKHIMEHTGEKPFKCTYCEKSFFENGHLTQHIRTHTGEKPYQCEFCSKSFSQGSSLRIHMKLHTTPVDDRQYTCMICSKNFSNFGNLQRHIVKHSGLRPHQCDICDKTFMEKCHLENHRVLHTGEKNHVCQYCSKAFSHCGNLRQHIRTHTGEKPHVCEVCNKAFGENSKLKEHFKIHTGEKNYHCDVCDKSFGQNGGLRRHMRQHTGEKPYECNECDKIYAHSHSLAKHKAHYHTNVEVLIQ